MTEEEWTYVMVDDAEACHGCGGTTPADHVVCVTAAGERMCVVCYCERGHQLVLW